MEKKIDLAEMLKDCPRDMELDCMMYDNLYLNKVNEDDLYPISCYTICDGIRNTVCFTEFGEFNRFVSSKCVIFPKGKTTWEGFVPPCKFKDGDIIFKYNFIAIISFIEPMGRIWYHCWYNTKHKKCKIKIDFGIGNINDDDEIRFATEEEKQKLFDTLKSSGYKWNAETKTLEKLIKPRFKVGNRVKPTYNTNQYIIKGITDTHYTLVEVKEKFEHTEPIIEDKNWELVLNKFDINTLKTFDQVLVRLTNNCIWMPKLFSHYDLKVKCYPFVTTDNIGYPQCIPYNGNEHLCRTINNCDKFYRVWE